VIKESIKLNWWHNAVKKLEKVKSKFYCKYKVNGKTKKKQNYCTWYLIQTIGLEGSIHTTTPTGS